MTDVMTFPTRNHDPDANIIAALEDMLADARRGEILSLVAVTSRRSESTQPHPRPNPSHPTLASRRIVAMMRGGRSRRC